MNYPVYWMALVTIAMAMALAYFYIGAKRAGFWEHQARTWRALYKEERRFQEEQFCRFMQIIADMADHIDKKRLEESEDAAAENMRRNAVRASTRIAREHLHRGYTLLTDDIMDGWTYRAKDGGLVKVIEINEDGDCVCQEVTDSLSPIRTFESHLETLTKDVLKSFYANVDGELIGEAVKE